MTSLKVIFPFLRETSASYTSRVTDMVFFVTGEIYHLLHIKYIWYIGNIIYTSYFEYKTCMHVKVDVYSGIAFALLIIGMSGIETAEKISGLEESDRTDSGFPECENRYLVKPGTSATSLEVLNYA
jgi:hypothetical protein